jgi:PPOX class probable F420-dependent enzyme
MAQLSPEDRKLFNDKNFVVLSTTRKDGSPRSVTLWVDVDGDEILVNGANSRAWIQNLRRDPRVALAIFDLADPYQRVSVQGTVTAIVDEGANDHYARLRQKYRGLSEEESRRRSADAEDRTVVRIRPDRVVSRPG